jgi:hypothetical protein
VAPLDPAQTKLPLASDVLPSPLLRRAGERR